MIGTQRVMAEKLLLITPKYTQQKYYINNMKPLYTEIYNKN